MPGTIASVQSNAFSLPVKKYPTMPEMAKRMATTRGTFMHSSSEGCRWDGMMGAADVRAGKSGDELRKIAARCCLEK